MSLNRKQFDVIFALWSTPGLTQRELSAATGLGLGTINAVLRELKAAGMVEGGCVTEAGLVALEPYRVDNAVIMAAGFSSRFAPLSYERPKGVLEVRGEVLIERQIRQLHEAGISDITVVVGYMQESFFYLADRFGVEIVVNEEYTSRNNNSTLMLVADKLANTYICSSDNYFAENVFAPYVYKAYYSVLAYEGETDEYCVETDRAGRITRITPGGEDALIMVGQAYFDREYSAAFRQILRRVYHRPETAAKLWEDIYLDHVDALDMEVRVGKPDVIFEFDSMADLIGFDHDFVKNVDSAILDHICSYFQCDRTDICDIEPIKEGLTNLSFRFHIDSKNVSGDFVYRHPGAGTDEIINRASEAYSQGVALELGVDTTFLYEDPTLGWKLSRYLPDCVPFDYHNSSHVSEALRLGRILHESGRTSEWTFDVYQKALEIVALLKNRAYPEFPDFSSLAETAENLYLCVTSDAVPSVLCHNDFYGPNFLVSPKRMDLIDWEYSAMSDYASDLGTFICCSDYSLEEAQAVIMEYLGPKASPEDVRHCLAYVSLSAYYWFVWALYKDATGDPVGEWQYLWYKAAKTYGRLATDLYRDAPRSRA